MAQSSDRANGDSGSVDSEAFLRTIIDLVPHEIFAKDAEGNFLLSNVAHANNYHLTPADVVGRNEKELSPHLVEAEKFLADDQEIIRTGEPKFIKEELFTTPNGEQIFLETSKIPFRLPDNRSTGVLGVAVDITAKKRMEISLQQVVEGTSRATGESYFHSLVEHLAKSIDAKIVLVAVIDPTDTNVCETIAVWNDGRLVENFQYELLGTPCDNVLDQTTCVHPEKVCEKFPDDHLLRDLGIESYAGSPLIGTGGEVLGLLAAMDDRSRTESPELRATLEIFANRAAVELERSRAENALRESEERMRQLNNELEQRVEQRTAELRKSNEDLEAYTRSVTHDLRAPIRAIEGYAKALDEDCADSIPDSGQEFIRRIVRSARRMETLIEDLMNYERLGRSELKLQEISLQVAVSDAMEQLSDEIAQSGASIDVAQDLPLVVANRSVLAQIAVNLISNAIKFHAPGVRPKLAIHAESNDSGFVRLWFEDNGIGVADKDHIRIFRSFERLHGIESFPGTGIGLAIVARACTRLRGRYGVESTVGAGSRFWVEVPSATPAS